MLKKSAYWINRLLWILLVTVLVLIAAYVSIGRYYTAHVEQYTDELMAQFVSYTGLPLTATRLYGSWSQLSPILTMENLVLHSPSQQGKPALTIDKVSFQLDVIGSLLARNVLVKQLGISGVHCELEETEPGKWQLKEYPTKGAGGTDFDKIIELVLSVDAAQLSAAAITLNYHQGNSALLDLTELSLLHDNEFRRLRLHATFDKAENPLLAVIEASGDPRDFDGFFARAYLKLDDVDFTDQLPLIRSFGVNLHDAEVDGEVWVDWKPRRIISIQGVTEIPQLDWAAITDSTPRLKTTKVEEKPPLKNIQLSFRAEKSIDNDWQFWLPKVRAQWSDEQLAVDKLYIGVHTDTSTVDVALPTLSLNQLTSQISSLKILGEKGQSILNALKPVGNLNNLHVQIALDKNTQPLFRMVSNLDAVGVSAWKGAPGAKGVDGYLEVTPSQGLVEFNSQQLSLDFPRIYHQPLDFNHSRGQVLWNIGAERMMLKSGPLQLQAEHGPAFGQLSLDLPIKGNKKPPLMTLVIGISDTDVSHRNKLIPYTLNKGFLNWLEKSIPEGEVIDGGFIYRGSLIPKAYSERTVQLYFNVKDTTLDYHPEWPVLQGINGLVMIDNNRVDVKTNQAKMYDLSIERANVKISPIASGGMWLDVDAKAIGDGKDALKIVTQSAIRKKVGSVFDNWKLRGETKASVSLGIPLAGAKTEADINVNVAFMGNKLQIPNFRLNFDHLKGPLHFSSKKGLTSSGIRGKLFGKPLALSMESASDKSILLDINGRVDMADVEKWSQQPALIFVSGETDFNAKMNIKGQGGGAFSVKSDLLGVNIDLPAPFNKSHKDQHPFWLTVPLSSSDTLLSMGLENKAKFQLQLENGQFNSALVTIETEPANDKTRYKPVDRKEGFFIVTGNGPEIPLAQWQDVFERYKSAASTTGKKGKDAKSTSVNNDSANTLIEVKDLSLTNIKAYGHNLGKTTINVRRRNGTFWSTISSDLLGGEFVIPDDESIPYKVDLQYIHLPKMKKKSVNTSPVDPTKFANIDINIADIAIGSEHYGSVAFDLRSDYQGARLENLTGNIRGVHIRKKKPGRLMWSNINGIESTKLNVQLDAGDLSKVLNNWNYEKFIESEKALIDLDFYWEGAPDQLKLNASTGTVKINVKNGRFLTASETASSTLKVVGIVNLANIARRLKLDFTDLYKRGIKFDKISGKLELVDSQLSIIDDLVVKSPSNAFKLRGDAYLEDESLDMEMIVTLPVANNLPWITALVPGGGIPTAAGMYVFGKIFEDQFDRLSSAIYTVKGDWNNPELKFKRVFDSKKKKKSDRKKSKDAVKNDAISSSSHLSNDFKLQGKKTVKNQDKPIKSDLSSESELQLQTGTEPVSQKSVLSESP